MTWNKPFDRYFITQGDAAVLPYKSRSGEVLHAIRPDRHPYMVIFSPQGYRAWKKYRKAPDTMTEEDKRLLNLCFDQAGMRIEELLGHKARPMHSTILGPDGKKALTR